MKQMSAQPRVRNAWWMSTRRSYRIVNRRCRLSHARVRAITHRCRPRRGLDSMPLRAIRTVMCRRCRNRRPRGLAYAVSACSLAGRLRRWPDGWRIMGTASISVSNIMRSCRFAPVRNEARGIPRRSPITGRFVPGLPRSVGLGPTAWPPVLPGPSRGPGGPAPRRSARRRRGEDGGTRPQTLPANH